MCKGTWEKGQNSLTLNFVLGRRRIHIKKGELSVHQEKLKRLMHTCTGCYMAHGWTKSASP